MLNCRWVEQKSSSEKTKGKRRFDKQGSAACSTGLDFAGYAKDFVNLKDTGETDVCEPMSSYTENNY